MDEKYIIINSGIEYRVGDHGLVYRKRPGWLPEKYSYKDKEWVDATEEGWEIFFEGGDGTRLYNEDEAYEIIAKTTDRLNGNK